VAADLTGAVAGAVTGAAVAGAADTGAVFVGVGASRGVSAEEVTALVRAALDAVGRPPGGVSGLATVATKAYEPGIRGAAAQLDLPLLTFPADALARVAVPNPSAEPLAALGTPSVAEAAALLAAAPGGRLELTKRKSARATVAVARTAPPPFQGEPPVHPDAHDLRHHGDAEVGDGLIDLAVNVRAGTPPPWLADRITASLKGLAAYPDGRSARNAVAARHGRPDGEVLLTAGAAEAFVLLARTLRPRRAIVVHPQFTEPEAALLDAGHEVERVLLDAADGFRLDPKAVPEDADLVVVGNPTNPTSVLHPAALVAELARPGRTLVVDEAFMDAVPGEREALAGVRDLPGLVVLRSLTKTWGLAGLRIGYVLGEPELIAGLGRAQPLWAVSTPALAAAEACVAPHALAEAAEAARQVTADRAYLVERLRGFTGVRVAGDTPAAPFLLLRLPDAAQVRLRLREMGYAVRRADTFPGLGPDWLRVAVRDHRTTDGFANALATALA
jgi:histidinol-phosphate aminotransferase